MEEVTFKGKKGLRFHHNNANFSKLDTKYKIVRQLKVGFMHKNDRPTLKFVFFFCFLSIKFTCRLHY